ncbi:tetratricopeptide repeat protein [Candidatus Albibeggiatoa sp. nov. NOAA]|uniref:tetratricopeptide repeat protein n=1 Tax=Candidatus Albibeggiatoa sp. nov. NOAA TaxID=3162724 RepID=UPI0033007ACB|nr:tetratricopeptide repeat protein [Thiotrichaceae bacterium]
MVIDNKKSLHTEGNIDESNVIVGGSNNQQNIYGIPPELFAQYVSDLGITDTALNNFFKILRQEKVDRADLDSKLREIAESYKKLQERATQLVSDDTEVQALQEKAQQALGEFDFESADKWLLEASEKDAQAIAAMEAEAQKIQEAVNKRKLSKVNTLITLADSKQTQLRYVEAAGLYQQAADLLPQGNEEDQAKYLNNAGFYFYHAGLYSRALPLYQRSLVIWEKVLGENHPYVASSLNNLAALYQDQGEYEQALPFYQRSLVTREKVLGENHPDVASSLNNLASLYQAQGKYEQALPLFERSLAIREKALGENHPDVASSLNNLASLYKVQGKYEQALTLFERSLMILEKVLGDNHPDVATNLNNLATLYLDQGEYEQALPLFERAIKILIEKSGGNHPNIQTVIRNYIGCLAESKGMTFEQSETD